MSFSNKNPNLLLLIIALFILVAGTQIYTYVTRPPTTTMPTPTPAAQITMGSSIAQVIYSDGKNQVKATFNRLDNTVTFTHPTTGTLSLPLAVSGSGTRYANPDETTVFWEHQGEVTLTSNGKQIFVGKIVN